MFQVVHGWHYVGIGARCGEHIRDRGKVFIADQGSGTVTVIDVVSFKKLAIIPVGRSPHNVQVAPDGKRVWVTNNGLPGGTEKQHAGNPGAGHGQGAGQGRGLGTR